MNQTKVFSDFSKTIPSAAISPEPRKGYWRVCEYTCGDIRGKLLYTDSKGDTPTLKLPLNLKGWHRVVIGVWGGLFDFHHSYAPSGNRVKLSGDTCFKSFERDRRPQLDEWDERWLRYRCRSLTQLVRELRAELDAVGKKLGKRIAISVTTFATELANVFYGLDLETWVREGLVDRITPWGKVRGMPPIDMDYYRRLVESSRTELWPHLTGRGDPADSSYNQYRKEALELYESGAAGLAVWDTCAHDGKSVLGPLLRRVGHIDELRAQIADNERVEPIIRKIDTLGHEDLRVVCVPETHKERIMPTGYDKHHYGWHG